MADVRGAGLDYSDARPSYFNLFIEPTRTPALGWNPASGGCMQSGSSSRSGRAAVEADAIGEQQLKRTQSVEADAIGEQQLKRTQSGSSSRSGRDREKQLKRTQAASSS